MEIRKLVTESREIILAARRALHRIPELGLDEKKTAAFIAERLGEMGLEVSAGVAGTGVVGLLDSGRPGPCLALRAELDALPILEDTGLPFASTHRGLMHACGHDGHMAVVLGVAALLVRLKGSFRGQVKLLFQPAEEGPGGAAAMIREGVLGGPAVDFILGCHLVPDLAEGGVAVAAGPVLGAVDRFDLTIKGKGGHGAMPHLSVDPIDTAAQVVSALQRVASRLIDPLKPVVVTVASFQAGSAFNVIPDSASLSGTARTLDPDTWQALPAIMERVIGAVCQGREASHDLRYTRLYPPLVNDPDICQVVRECAARSVGPDNVHGFKGALAGDDFACFLEKIPGCYFFLGVGREGGYPLHNARFDFNEDVLLTGVDILVRAALRLLT